MTSIKSKRPKHKNLNVKCCDLYRAVLNPKDPLEFDIQ